MEGFTVSLALLDAVPVLCFGASMLLIAGRFGSGLFLAGALLSTFAGCCKVTWKLVLGIWKKNLHWLNRPFVPMQAAGFLLILLSFLFGFSRISWSGVWDALCSLPAGGFFVCWALGMAAMVWFRKTKFDNSPRANWTAECINSAAQLCLLAGLLSAGR